MYFVVILNIEHWALWTSLSDSQLLLTVFYCVLCCDLENCALLFTVLSNPWLVLRLLCFQRQWLCTIVYCGIQSLTGVATVVFSAAVVVHYCLLWYPIPDWCYDCCVFSGSGRGLGGGGDRCLGGHLGHGVSGLEATAATLSSPTTATGGRRQRRGHVINTQSCDRVMWSTPSHVVKSCDHVMRSTPSYVTESCDPHQVMWLSHVIHTKSCDRVMWSTPSHVTELCDPHQVMWPSYVINT